MPNFLREILHILTRVPRTQWGVCALLILPVIYIYGLHFYMANLVGLSPTGFLQYDQAYYMANARQHFDNGFSFFYSLPFSTRLNSPEVYFQPHILFLGTLHYLTDFPPGYLYAFIGIIAALVCARVGVSLFETVVGLNKTEHWIGLVIFFWGGGILAVVGFLLSKVGLSEGMFDFDPFKGMWFLNFGRNLILTTEAFYHMLSLGIILSCWLNKYRLALFLLLVLSLSHPFTGIQLILVVGGWATLENVLLRKKEPPYFLLIGTAVLAAFHLANYLFFLNTSAEHRILQEQWTVEWLLPPMSMLLAYGLVGALVAARFLSSRFSNPLLDEKERLLAMWFLVSLALAKHELFIEPIQPLHFTRGYIWIPLFLLGAPVLIDLIGRALRLSQAPAKFGAVGLILIVALSDNFLWFTVRNAQILDENRTRGIGIKYDQVDILDRLNAEQYKNHLVVTHDKPLAYMTTVYTPLQSWYSHSYNTPNANRKFQQIQLFFSEGAGPKNWSNRKIAIIANSRKDQDRIEYWENSPNYQIRESNDTYVIITRDQSANAL